MNALTGNGPELAPLNMARRAAIAMVAASLALSSLVVNAQDGDPDNSGQNSGQAGSFDMEGVSVWFKNRFSEVELQTYQPEDFRIESHMCSCYDRPVPHYPYLLVFFATPKGDLVGRPDRRGLDTIITRLAVRHGERYCDVESEDECYGSFSDPCDFSDFRYGRQLADYFPTCKSVEPDPDSELTPVGYQFLR
jgi:hypothetical protein